MGSPLSKQSRKDELWLYRRHVIESRLQKPLPSSEAPDRQPETTPRPDRPKQKPGRRKQYLGQLHEVLGRPGRSPERHEQKPDRPKDGAEPPTRESDRHRKDSDPHSRGSERRGRKPERPKEYSDLLNRELDWLQQKSKRLRGGSAQPTQIHWRRKRKPEASTDDPKRPSQDSERRRQESERPREPTEKPPRKPERPQSKPDRYKRKPERRKQRRERHKPKPKDRDAKPDGQELALGAHASKPQARVQWRTKVCSVCMEPVIDMEIVKRLTLDCKHKDEQFRICRSCLRKWIRSNRKKSRGSIPCWAPNCGAELGPEVVEQFARPKRPKERRKRRVKKRRKGERPKCEEGGPEQLHHPDPDPNDAQLEARILALQVLNGVRICQKCGKPKKPPTVPTLQGLEEPDEYQVVGVT